MRTIVIIGAMMLQCVLFFVACNKSEKAPNGVVGDNFNKMYPDAKNVEWEMEHGYYVAEFRDGGHEKEAWFDSDYVWVLTKVEYNRNAPDVVKSSIHKTNYKDWHIDDIDFILMRAKDSFYIVEVEKGEAEVNLYFSETGELLEEFTDGRNYYRELF